MAKSDIEVAKEATERFGRGDIEELLPLIHPEFEGTTPPGLAAEPDTYRGHEGIRRYFESFYEAMDRVWLEADEFREVGGKVVVPGKLWSRGRSTGLESSIDGVFVWTIRDEQVIRAEIFATEEEALAASEGDHPGAG
jgi:ketosteroid isomerase-like protein